MIIVVVSLLPTCQGNECDPFRVREYSPLLARTGTSRQPVGLAMYDCVRVVIVRDGSAILFSEFGEVPVAVGHVALLGANVLCGAEPEGHITSTAVYLDTDYIVDMVFWHYADVLCDRLDAKGVVDTLYAEPAQYCGWEKNVSVR